MSTDKNVNKNLTMVVAKIPERRRRTQEGSRENILAAAEAILSAGGPMDLKLTEVAHGADVATATVLHHFGSIGGVHAALMDRMITRLVARVVGIAEAGADAQAISADMSVALFDAFEEQGAARLAAWLVMTGDAAQLSMVRQAVDQVIDLTRARMPAPPARVVLEDLVLGSITLALGAGLFGGPLSALLGRPADSGRRAGLEALAAWEARLGVG
jgi:AcrR family transcriptional regulator